MQIKRLSATFGKLEQEQLNLGPGLNVIEAPNEAGKSTWTAFLRVMLYGLNTRDRSAGADKRRYLPWSGSAMNGAMDLSLPQGEVTITRRTARANSPMGAFSAVYTGTASPVDFLTAAGCGETLLGVPQEVYVRSALIRQGGLAIGPHAALEQRINALVTTGEEDVSCSAVSGITDSSASRGEASVTSASRIRYLLRHRGMKRRETPSRSAVPDSTPLSPSSSNPRPSGQPG